MVIHDRVIAAVEKICLEDKAEERRQQRRRRERKRRSRGEEREEESKGLRSQQIDSSRGLGLGKVDQQPSWSLFIKVLLNFNLI